MSEYRRGEAMRARGGPTGEFVRYFLDTKKLAQHALGSAEVAF
jgi:hypothetical protein